MSDFISDLMGGVVNKVSSGLVSCIWRKTRGRLELSSETSYGRRDNEEVKCNIAQSRPFFSRKIDALKLLLVVVLGERGGHGQGRGGQHVLPHNQGEQQGL